MLTIEARLVNKLRECNLNSLKHVSFWCLFLELHCNIPIEKLEIEVDEKMQE